MGLRWVRLLKRSSIQLCQLASEPGVARRQLTFFCVAKRKSAKKRRPDCLSFWGQSPNSPSLRLALRVRCKAPQRNWCLTPITRNLRCSIPAGVGRTRFAQTTAALDTASICAARPSQTGFGGRAGFGEAGTRKARPRRSPLANPVRLPAPPPVGLGRGAQAKADQGRHLSEPKASLCLTPLLASTAGCPQRNEGSQTIGSPFFSLGFFGDAKKSKSPAGARPGLPAHHYPTKRTRKNAINSITFYARR